MLDQRSYRYLVFNLVGSAVLAVDAYSGGQWGFLLLEGAWAVVSAWGLYTRMRESFPPSTRRDV